MTQLEVTEKQCPTCGEAKSLAEFHRSRGKSQGVSWQCKDCARAYAREKQRQLRSTPEGRALANERRRRSYAKDPTATKMQNEARQVAITALIDRHRREFDALYRIEAHARGITVRQEREA